MVDKRFPKIGFEMFKIKFIIGFQMFKVDFQLCVHAQPRPTMAAPPQDIYFGQNSIITHCHSCQRYDVNQETCSKHPDLKLNFCTHLTSYREVRTVVEGRAGAGAWISAALLCLIGFCHHPCHHNSHRQNYYLFEHYRFLCLWA